MRPFVFCSIALLFCTSSVGLPLSSIVKSRNTIDVAALLDSMPASPASQFTPPTPEEIEAANGEAGIRSSTFDKLPMSKAFEKTPFFVWGGLGRRQATAKRGLESFTTETLAAQKREDETDLNHLDPRDGQGLAKTAPEKRSSLGWPSFRRRTLSELMPRGEIISAHKREIATNRTVVENNPLGFATKAFAKRPFVTWVD